MNIVSAAATSHILMHMQFLGTFMLMVGQQEGHPACKNLLQQPWRLSLGDLVQSKVTVEK